MTNIPKNSLICTEEAIRLINMDKYFVSKADKKHIILPSGIERTKTYYNLISESEIEKFLIGFSTRNISIYRGCSTILRNEKHKNIPLFRIDLSKDKPHKNPNGQTIYGYHAHIYDEEYGDKIAIPLTEIFPELDDNARVDDVFKNFLKYCHVKDQPEVELLVV